MSDAWESEKVPLTSDALTLTYYTYTNEGFPDDYNLNVKITLNPT